MITGFYTRAHSTSQSYDFWPAPQPEAPLFIYVHGGAWRFGDKSSASYSEVGTHRLREKFAAAGFATASINYRLSEEALFPAQIHDVKAAVAHFKKHAKKFGIDPNKIVLAGGSAGGHLALFTGATASLENSRLSPGSGCDTSVAAVVSIYGVSDLRTIFEDRELCGQPRHHPDDAGAEELLLGSTYPAPEGCEAEKNWATAHPIDYVWNAGLEMAPTYLIHGDADGCVPYIQSQRVYEALRERELACEYMLVTGADHADPLCFTDQVLDPVVAWACEQLSWG